MLNKDITVFYLLCVGDIFVMFNFFQYSSDVLGVETMQKFDTIEVV